jgi:septal ring factor EnvC (AmiA/AmiB activator)
MKKIFVIIFLFSAVCSFAADDRISNLQKQRQTMMKEIAETKKQIEANRTTMNNAQERLHLLDKSISSQKQLIGLLNEEIAVLDSAVREKEAQIVVMEKDIRKRKDFYAEALKKIYRHRRDMKDNLLFILASDGITQSLHRISWLREYSSWGRRQGEEIIARQRIVENEKAALLSARSEKTALLDERRTQEQNLLSEEQAKKQEIRSLEKDSQRLQATLKKKQQQADALNRQIEKIIAEETRKSNAAPTKSVQREERKAEVRGGYAMTAAEQKLSSQFAANRGKLPMPLKGKYNIVDYFGVHQHRDLSHVSVRNNGIEIETVAGNEARAVFDGVVSRIFILPGYNSSVIVRHGNYLTLYSNLGSVGVRQGDRVKTGQSLGVIFTDKENGNTTTLHFELWKEQNKLDPLPWLNR